jgi:hypothetical protein
MGKQRRDDSKYILAKLVLLYEHLDKLRSISKPRPDNVKMLIEAVHIRIDKEKKKLRNIGYSNE